MTVLELLTGLPSTTEQTIMGMDAGVADSRYTGRHRIDYRHGKDRRPTSSPAGMLPTASVQVLPALVPPGQGRAWVACARIEDGVGGWFR